MSVTTTAHINFRGNAGGTARTALQFYQSVFGGQSAIFTYADIHAVEDPAQADDVAFGRLTADNGFDIMAYDVQPSKGYAQGQNPFYSRYKALTPKRSRPSGRDSAMGRPRS